MNNRPLQPEKIRKKKKRTKKQEAQAGMDNAKRAAKMAALRGTELPDFTKTNRSPKEIEVFISKYNEWRSKPQEELDWHYGYKRGYDKVAGLLEKNAVEDMLSNQENGKQLYLNILEGKLEFYRAKKSEQFLNGFEKGFCQHIKNKSNTYTLKASLKRKLSEDSFSDEVSNQPAQKRRRISRKNSSTTLAFIAICPSSTPDLTFENTQSVPDNSLPSLIGNSFFPAPNTVDVKPINSNALGNEENSNWNSFINKPF